MSSEGGCRKVTPWMNGENMESMLMTLEPSIAEEKCVLRVTLWGCSGIFVKKQTNDLFGCHELILLCHASIKI